MKDYPEGEVMSAGAHGNGSGSTVLYKVEARTSAHEPEMLSGVKLDGRWREVPFQIAPDGIGVPARSSLHPHHTTGMEYEAAEALRWWLHANARNGIGGWCLETRLVAYRLNWKYDTEEIGVSEKQMMPRGPFHSFTPRTAIAMEAATAGETREAGLDPKDDSAGPQGIAQRNKS